MSLDDYAQVFNALSNPHRLRIMLILVSCCPPGNHCEVNERKYVGDISGALDLAPSTVSHHLKELRRAGLISTERTGQNVQCWINPDILKALAAFFEKPDAFGQENAA